jgi:hypothetical protein
MSNQPTGKGSGPGRPPRPKLVLFGLFASLCIGLTLALVGMAVGRDWGTVGYALGGVFMLLCAVGEFTEFRGWGKGNRVAIFLMLLLGVIWLTSAVLRML